MRAGCESKTGEPEPYLLDAIGFLRALATKLRDQVGADAETGAPLALERLVTTEEMRHSVSVREGARANWAVRVSAPIDGPDVDLPVDPYVLGAWLGDGSTGAGVLTQGTAEECTDESGLTDQAHLLEQLNAAGYNARVLPCHSNLIGTRGITLRSGSCKRAGRRSSTMSTWLTDEYRFACLSVRWKRTLSPTYPRTEVHPRCSSKFEPAIS